MKKRLRFVCGCGQENHNLEDWLAHWKYGVHGKLHAVKLFLTTRIEWLNQQHILDLGAI